MCYSSKLTLWGIETSIVIPGAYSKGTAHFAHAATPDDDAVDAAYEEGAYEGYRQRILNKHLHNEPKNSNPKDVTRTIMKMMRLPREKRSFRIHVKIETDRSHLVK